MRPALLAALLLVLPGGALAQPAPNAGEVRAVRTRLALTVDGVLDEAAWQEAPAVGGFRQRAPNEGAEASQRTEVRVVYDDDAIYVGAWLHDAHPDSIVAPLTRRDSGTRSDQFTVYLDPYFDRRSGYYFSINAAGTLADGTLYNDGWSDNSWDAVWDGRAKVGPEGWTAEFRIPFSQLRFAHADVQKWGINFQRALGRDFEDDYLVFQPRKESGFVSRFPTLVGLERVTPSRAIEIVPYATSKAEFLRHAPGDPFHDGSRVRPNLGGDLRMPLGGKLTLNATVNPDFGQVEVDPAVVNLSDVETFFPEKRPFFVEGSSIFDAGQQGASDYWSFNWPQPTFFYSRRIGRAPQGGLMDGTEFSDVPGGTTILGAAKLSGKLSEGMNFGTLHAITSKEHANLELDDLSRVNDWEVEPLTYYGVARLLKEFPERRNGLGVLSTLAARSFEDRRLEADFPSASAMTVVDGWHYLDSGKVWVLTGWAGGSHVRGSKDLIRSVQTSSRHYFQRPDAHAFEFDPDRTSLSGGAARLWLNKEKGNWISNSGLGFLSPGFEVNDVGFMSRADLINGHMGVGYRWTNPTRYVKNHNVLGAVFANGDFDGNLTWAGVWGSGFWWFTNNWTLQLRGALNPETVNPRRSRGGPLMLNEPGYELSSYFDTDGGRPRYYSASAYMYTQPEEGSYNWSLYPYMSWKPKTNVTVSLGPGYEVSRDGAYYFTTLDDPTATATFGHRYVFAQLDQKTLSANVRLDIAFTPRMSLQFFGQPLIATARYTDLKELARPKSLAFVGPGAGPWTYDAATGKFDPDGPGGAEESYSSDFNFKSLRGNAIFRWEYMPGSTLFLVWTQERTDEESLADFNVGPSFRRLIRADADNIFLAKLTYYFNL